MDETENIENNQFEIEELVKEINSLKKELNESREINRKLVNSIKTIDNSNEEDNEIEDTLESFMDDMIKKYVIKE